MEKNTKYVSIVLVSVILSGIFFNFLVNKSALECVSHTDCLEGNFCLNGKCAPLNTERPCVNDKWCWFGERCINDKCVLFNDNPDYKDSGYCMKILNAQLYQDNQKTVSVRANESFNIEVLIKNYCNYDIDALLFINHFKNKTPITRQELYFTAPGNRMLITNFTTSMVEDGQYTVAAFIWKSFDLHDPEFQVFSLPHREEYSVVQGGGL